MRGLLTPLLVLALAGTGVGQTIDLKPSAAQFVSVSSGASASVVAPGGTVTLWADVTPKPNIHVYASGAKNVSAVALVMTPRVEVAAGKPSYPPSELVLTVGASAPVPVYRKTFRIAQPMAVTRSAKAGEILILAGAVNYQACDDTTCYPPASISVLWHVTVK